MVFVDLFVARGGSHGRMMYLIELYFGKVVAIMPCFFAVLFDFECLFGRL